MVYVDGTYNYIAITLQQCVLGSIECVYIGNYKTPTCLQGSKGYQGLPGLPGTRGLPVSYYID